MLVSNYGILPKGDAALLAVKNDAGEIMDAEAVLEICGVVMDMNLPPFTTQQEYVPIC